MQTYLVQIPYNKCSHAQLLSPSHYFEFFLYLGINWFCFPISLKLCERKGHIFLLLSMVPGTQNGAYAWYLLGNWIYIFSCISTSTSVLQSPGSRYCWETKKTVHISLGRRKHIEKGGCLLSYEGPLVKQITYFLQILQAWTVGELLWVRESSFY